MNTATNQTFRSFPSYGWAVDTTSVEHYGEDVAVVAARLYISARSRRALKAARAACDGLPVYWRAEHLAGIIDAIGPEIRTALRELIDAHPAVEPL